MMLGWHLPSLEVIIDAISHCDDPKEGRMIGVTTKLCFFLLLNEKSF